MTLFGQSRHGAIFVTAVFGVLCGVAVAELRPKAPSPSTVANSSPPPTVLQPTIVVQSAPRGESEISSATPEATQRVTSSPSAELRTPPNPAEYRNELETAHSVALAAHEAEPRSSWGRKAEAEFRDDLLRISDKAAFKLLDVDCRATTCAANVQFDTLTAARRGWVAIAVNAYAENCSKDVLLDDVTDPAARTHASVFFDCAGH